MPQHVTHQLLCSSLISGRQQVASFEKCHCHAGNLFQIDFTPRLYSFAGCSCSDAQDFTAITYVDAQGNTSMTPLPSQQSPQAKPLQHPDALACFHLASCGL